jgi:pSer/pThr/pTyr-binding forkhead associated (FHA) protein
MNQRWSSHPPTEAEGEHIQADTAPASLFLRHGDRLQAIDLRDGADLVVGRVAGAHVVVDDAKVSREHARFTLREGAVHVEDLRSRNGTRVNDRVLHGEEARLVSGDVVRIGPAELVLSEPRQVTPTSVVATAPVPEGVIAIEPAMLQLFDRVRRVARTQTTVLVLGETGVG